jgi:methylase of polypeptide subunit release factors
MFNSRNGPRCHHGIANPSGHTIIRGCFVGYLPPLPGDSHRAISSHMTANYLELHKPEASALSRISDLDENSWWSRGTEHELKLHRIHAYPAKFPAFIAAKALSYAESEGVKVKTLADMFCGCGTVAFEARRHSLDFWGCDINPVATLIAKTKSTTYDIVKLEEYYNRILHVLRHVSSATDLSDLAIERLSYWYAAKQFRDIARLLNAVRVAVPARSPYRLFFLCAVSNILKATSRWLTKSIKPQIDPRKEPVHVKDAFQAQFILMLAAWKEAGVKTTSRIRVVTGNILDVDRTLSRVDMIVTSPPYVTSYEYADLHQLSALWLGYASDYRELRVASIGSTRHNLNFDREIKRLNTTGSRVVFSLFDRKKSIAKSTAKYFLDMQKVSKRCFSLLRPSGIALFVIGNTSYAGVRIDNAAHLTESLLNVGFSRVRVTKRKMSGKILTPYRDQAGRFSRSSTGRHVYGEEFIVIANR